MRRKVPPVSGYQFKARDNMQIGQIALFDADVAEALRDHVARGMDLATAIRITASSLAARTAYSE